MSGVSSKIAIGNPGAGKSTTLNYLAGELLFTSGVSFGSGLTSMLDEKENKAGRVFMDTPGLSDRMLRVKAGKAISKALKKGGGYKIIFFVRQQDGRPVNEDMTTMNLVLEAAPEIGKQYAIIVPKVAVKMAKLLLPKENWASVVAGLFAGLHEDRQCGIHNIHALFSMNELIGENDKIPAPGQMKSINRVPLEKLLEYEVDGLKCFPDVTLTTNKAGDVDTDSYEDKSEKMSKLVKEAQENKAEVLRLQNEVSNSRGLFGAIGAVLDEAANFVATPVRLVNRLS